MKVRNLKQYIDILTNGRSVISSLGSKDDLLLKEYAGKVENLDQHITDLPNFATDARTQIFYELMQNAEDAVSESLHFFFDDQAILVINNGLPFLTDSTEEEGQLFEFLFKGKGRKANNPDKIGEHGQGSKLLYSLILPNEYWGDKKEVVRKNLIHDLFGPILFSWQRELDITQLSAWKNQPFEYTGNCEDLYFPLLAKVILTYYPAELGQVANLYNGREKELFSKTEMASLVEFLNRIRSKVNWTDFRRGTLLYIPLGDGQGEKMVNNWGGALRQGISISLDFLKHLKYVYVNGEQIRRSGLHVVQLDNLTGGEKPVALQLAMPKVGERLPDSAINFYKFFPIVKARYGLNYLINTKAYDVGAARQEIDITDDNNKHILMDISVRIVEYIQQLREDQNREELIQFLRCVVHNVPQDQFFRDHFHDKLLLAFKENLPTESGFADSATNVRIKKNALPIQPEDLGISEWEWLDESLSDLYDQIERQLNVSAYTLTGLLEAAAANEKYKTWMAGLSNEYYQQLLEGIQAEVKEPSQLQNIRCWRFSDGEIYTLKEISEKESLILVLPEMQALGLFLLRGQALLGGYGLDRLNGLDQLIRRSIATLPTLMWDRITANLVTLESLTRDEKWAIFRVYHGNPVAQRHIAGQLSIFLNTRGEKRALGQLSNQTAEWAPSGILREYSILASEFIPELSSHFIKKEEVWNQLGKDWHLVARHLLEGPESYPNKLSDLNRLFSFEKENKVLPDDVKWVFTKDKLLPSTEVYCHDKLMTLSKPQYEIFEAFLKTNSNLSASDAILVAAILNVKFARLPEVGLRAIENHFESKEVVVSKPILEILNNIKNDGEDFFYHFIIKSNALHNEITLKVRDSKEIQYFSEDQHLIQFINTKEGYSLLPQGLKSVFDGDKSLRMEPTDDAFVGDLLNKFGAIPPFVDIISKRGNLELKKLFLVKLAPIDLSSGDSPHTYFDTFEFKVIKLITGVDDWADQFKSKITIDERPLEDFNYNEKVKIGDFSTKFELSKLLPDLGGHSSKLATVKTKLERSGFHKLLDNKDLPILDIINRIKTPNAYQLAFILVANKFGEKTQNWYPTKYILSGIEQENALDQFYQLNLSFFSDFKFPENWFNIKNYILAQRVALLLEHEIVPNWILEWMDGDLNKLRFLEAAGLRINTHPIIRFRSAFDSNLHYDYIDFLDAFRREGADLNDTLKWIKLNFSDISLHSNREINLRKLLEYFWETNKKLPEELPFLKLDAEENRLLVKIDIPDWPKIRYVEAIAKEEDNIWYKIIESQDLVFIYTPDLYGQGIREGLRKRNISKAWLVKEISSELNVTGLEAWDDSIYMQWKAQDAPEIDIFLLNQSVPFNYYFESVNIRALIEQSSGKIADRLKTSIYIFKNNPAVNIFQILSEHQEVLFQEDAHLLVKLLARKVAAGNTVDIFSEAQKIKIQDNLQEFQNIIDKFDSTEVKLLSENADKILPMLKDGNLENILIVEDENLRNAISDNLSIIGALAEKDAFEVIGKLLERASKEQLEKLLDIWDEVEQELEKERSKPKPVALIGYLGERLVYLWLLKKETNPQNVNHVGKTEPAFDVHLNHDNREYCVEVKTTIKSAREVDSAIPFFLRASQYDFIQRNPDKDYIVFRLSLQDIGLTHLYDDFKIFGTDLDTILDNCGSEIDEKLIEYINTEYSANRFKRNRLVFKMNIPKIDLEFWED